MIKTIKFEDQQYPAFQASGHASRFAAAYASMVCAGIGYDIGCKNKDWALSGSIPIDKDFPDDWHAENLPMKNVDYIFSSHCLEHIKDWIEVMEYWHKMLKPGGVLFLYLPDYSQKYWRPWNNKKHKNIFTPEIIKDFMLNLGYRKIFKSGVDLNNSFMIFGEKSEKN
jgi:SAM-dependent methyltransferase